MSLQLLYFRIHSFFHCIFESLTMRTKSKYHNDNEEDEILYLNKSNQLEI
jgi:hypothetical protein